MTLSDLDGSLTDTWISALENPTGFSCYIYMPPKQPLNYYGQLGLPIYLYAERRMC